jgi:hypothetical protein
MSPRQRRQNKAGASTVTATEANVIDDWPEAEVEQVPAGTETESIWDYVSMMLPELPVGWDSTIKVSDLLNCDPSKLPGEDFYMPKFSDDHWGEDGLRSIPKWEEVKHYRPRITQGYFACLAIRCGESHMAYGMPGTGKTEFYRWLGASLNWPVFVKAMSKGMEEGDFFGTWTSSHGNLVFKESFLPQAMRLGAICVIDEITGGPNEFYTALHSVAQAGGALTMTGGGADTLAEAVIEPTDTFRFVALDNHNGEGDDSGQFVGTGVLNSALRDRLTTMIEFDYLEADAETEVLMSLVDGLPERLAGHMVATAGVIREAYEQGALSMTMSMRTLKVWGAKMLNLRDAQAALEVTFTNKFASEEMRETVRMAVDATFGTDVRA